MFETKTSLDSKHDAVLPAERGISGVKYRDDKVFLAVEHVPRLRLQEPLRSQLAGTGQSVLLRVQERHVDIRSGRVVQQHSGSVLRQPHKLWVKACRALRRNIRIRRRLWPAPTAITSISLFLGKSNQFCNL